MSLVRSWLSERPRGALSLTVAAGTAAVLLLVLDDAAQFTTAGLVGALDVS
ncbi:MULTISPECIES: hypothetical protein [Streptomyces]|uniref:hypothetical protein n=1 Tax=Streptomyces TaxID=1883 RepID=UPI000A6200CD|nr:MULTISPECIES: hypothetical protein [Streptomyces]